MAGVLAFIGYELSRSGTLASQAAPTDQLPTQRNPNEWARWVITEHLSAHRAFIGHVETRFLDEAVAITQQIAEPVKDRYAEILIYFHRPGRPDPLPPRRVQWDADARLPRNRLLGFDGSSIGSALGAVASGGSSRTRGLFGRNRNVCRLPRSARGLLRNRCGI